MELKTFIAETLIGIQQGVQAAIERTEQSKGAINPCFGTTTNGMQQLVQLVEFDLAVTVADGPDRQGEGEIEVLTGKVGGKPKKSKDVANLSRIQFAIPILPAIQMMNAEDSSEIVAESLRRARKVAGPPGLADPNALQGSGSVPAAPEIDASAEQSSGATQHQ